MSDDQSTADGFLPPTAELISVGGLDSAETFAVSSVASDHAVDRRPVSVRELVTPQRETDMSIASTGDDLARILGEPDDDSKGLAPGAIQWKNWLDDYETSGSVVGAELSVFGADDMPWDVRRRGLLGSLVEMATGAFRGVGAGHSHSEAAKPRDGFNDLKNVAGDLEPSDEDRPRWLKSTPPSYHDDETEPIDPTQLVRVGAGTSIKRLNREVLPEKGLALPNMGSWDGQTLAGAINTSTHGTGLGLGTLADLVRSVEIAVVPEARTASGKPHVRLLRVEPSGGITDPAAFAEDTYRHDAELIQNDELFHSVVVGYGSMGVVYAYTIECRDAFWLHEETAVRYWNDIDLRTGAESYRHYNVNVLLASEVDNPPCQVRTREIASRNEREPTERTDVGQTIDEFIDTLPQKLVNAATGGSTDHPGLQTIVPTGPRWKVGETTPAPFRNERSETASYIALRRRYARYPDQHRKPPETPPDVITTEVNVPISRVEPAVEAVIDYVQQTDRWFPVPLGVRFTAGSKHKLSPEYDREDGTAMLEFGVPVLDLREVEVGETKADSSDAPVAKKLLARLDLREVEVGEATADSGEAPVAKKLLARAGQEHLLSLSEAKRELENVEDVLVKRFDGRPHMGKHNTVDTDSDRSYMQPSEIYDEYGTWLAAHRYVNRFGTFDADFTDNKVA